MASTLCDSCVLQSLLTLFWSFWTLCGTPSCFDSTWMQIACEVSIHLTVMPSHQQRDFLSWAP
jgi:hypothetical protein